MSTEIAIELALYDNITGSGNITLQWIADRAYALTAFGEYWRRGEMDGVLGAVFGLPVVKWRKAA